MRRNLDATHVRFGPLQFPRSMVEGHEPAAVNPADHNFDLLDIPAYHAALTRKIASAVTASDDPSLSSDQRQFHAGMKRGLQVALSLLMGTRLAATPAKDDDSSSITPPPT